jgi:hypothetical protein
VPFLRFSRDKRGYEHVYLVHASHGRGRSSPARVLYWYRTPPSVKVGREPFDEAARCALEAEYPNLDFDWKRILSTPFPPPETENWRERRRAQRELRQAQAQEPRESTSDVDDLPAEASAADAAPQAATEVVVSTSDAATPVRQAEEGRRRRRRGRRRGRPMTSNPVATSNPVETSNPAVTDTRQHVQVDVERQNDSTRSDASSADDTFGGHEQE